MGLLYAEDSFFTLGLGGRIGLVLLSVILSGLSLWLTWWAATGLKRVWRVLIALGVFWAFVWLSPQVYYTYYIAIFEDLPWQVVVKSPPTLPELARLFSFMERATLSAHGQAVLGWALVVTGLLRRRGQP